MIRHGEASAKWGAEPDPGLSKLGFRQAIDVVTKVSPALPADIDVISSPLRRARETAEPLRKALGEKPLTIVDAFREIPVPATDHERAAWFKSVESQSWGQQPAMLQQWRASAIERVHAIESNAVIFTHFMVINAIVGSLGKNEEMQVFRPDNCSVTRLVRRGGVLQVSERGREMTTVVN